MQSLQLVVAAGFITGLFTLAGVVIGPWLKARTEEDHWRRQLRLDAYADMYRAVVELALATDDPDEEAVKSRKNDLYRAEVRVRLVAPKSVRAASYNLSRKLADGIEDAELRETDEFAGQVAELIEAFAEAARRDLEIDEGAWLRGRLDARS